MHEVCLVLRCQRIINNKGGTAPCACVGFLRVLWFAHHQKMYIRFILWSVSSRVGTPGPLFTQGWVRYREQVSLHCALYVINKGPKGRPCWSVDYDYVTLMFPARNLCPKSPSSLLFCLPLNGHSLK